MDDAREPKPYWEYWYEVVTETSLRQGDILRDLLVYALLQDVGIPDQPQSRLTVGQDRSDWIVMSASCDVVRDPADYPYVLLGRVLPADEAELKAQNRKELEQKTEILRRGLFPTFFLLADHPESDPVFPLSFVQFRVHLTLPANFIRTSVEGRKRLRLRAPIREKFGNWVGENFSRVGPEDVMSIPGIKRMSPSALLRMAEEND